MSRRESGCQRAPGIAGRVFLWGWVKITMGKDFGPPLEDAFWQQAKCAESLKVFLTARFYFFAVHAAQGAWVDRLGGRRGNRQEEESFERAYCLLDRRLGIACSFHRG